MCGPIPDHSIFEARELVASELSFALFHILSDVLLLTIFAESVDVES